MASTVIYVTSQGEAYDPEMVLELKSDDWHPEDSGYHDLTLNDLARHYAEQGYHVADHADYTMELLHWNTHFGTGSAA